MAEGKGGSLFKKLVLGVSSLAALGGAHEVGRSAGHESGYEAGEKAGRDAEQNDHAAKDEAERKKREEEANNFVAKQDQLLQEYRKLEIDSFEKENTPKDVAEISDQLARAKALDAFKNYKMWLRANSDEELFKSVSLLVNLVQSNFENQKSGITIPEVQALMAKDPELRSRIEYVFQAYSKLRDGVKNGKIELVTIDIDTGQKLGERGADSMNIRLNQIAKILKVE